MQKIISGYIIEDAAGNELYQGIAIAKAEGKYKGRQPLPFDEKEFKRECEKWVKGSQTAVDTMKKLGMKPNRFYRYAKKYGFNRGYA